MTDYDVYIQYGISFIMSIELTELNDYWCVIFHDVTDCCDIVLKLSTDAFDDDLIDTRFADDLEIDWEEEWSKISSEPLKSGVYRLGLEPIWEPSDMDDSTNFVCGAKAISIAKMLEI